MWEKPSSAGLNQTSNEGLKGGIHKNDEANLAILETKKADEGRSKVAKVYQW
jgi:hypothetical protein